MKKIKIIKIDRTSFACPAQWDMWDSKDNYYYVRFRWGELTINKHEVFGELVFSNQTDSDWNGFMEEEELIEMVSEVFYFSKCVYYEYGKQIEIEP